MDYYTPKKLRPLGLVAMFLRSLIRLLEFWPVFAVLALFILPETPHLRIQYRYIDRGNYKIMTRCDYLGPHGFINYRMAGDCPLVVIVNPKKHAYER